MDEAKKKGGGGGGDEGGGGGGGDKVVSTKRAVALEMGQLSEADSGGLLRWLWFDLTRLGGRK